MLKHCINEVCQLFTVMFNKFFEDGIVPTGVKIVKVIPVFKADDKKIVSNYRPISILPVLSKVIESLVYNRLIEFFTKHNILSSSQYGFRKIYQLLWHSLIL